MRPLLPALLVLLSLALAGCSANNATLEPDVTTPSAVPSSSTSVVVDPSASSGGAPVRSDAPPAVPGATVSFELARSSAWTQPNASWAKTVFFYAWGATGPRNLSAAQFFATLPDGTTLQAVQGSATPVATTTDGWGDIHVEGDSGLPRDLPVTIKPGMTLRIAVDLVAPDGTPEPASLGWRDGTTTFTFPLSGPTVNDDKQMGNGY